LHRAVAEDLDLMPPDRLGFFHSPLHPLRVHARLPCAAVEPGRGAAQESIGRPRRPRAAADTVQPAPECFPYSMRQFVRRHSE
jgi:hypothetical protein